MISILLPAFSSEALLRKVFLPGLANSRSEIELILYDNGGNGDLSHLRGLGLNIVVLGNGENVGLNQAFNQCAQKARGSYFYLPHTDMYLMPGWDTALLEAAESLPDRATLLCSRSIEPTKGHTDFHIIQNYGRDPENFDQPRLLKDFGFYTDIRVVTGYRMPFFLHRELWEKMNGVDPRYFSYCSDDDLVQTAYDVGVRRFGMVFGSLVYHLQGQSNAVQKVDRNSSWPYDYFLEKWKSKYRDADEPSLWHPSLIPMYERVR